MPVTNNFRLSDIEDMMPWEREIYISLMNQKIKEINEEARKLK